MKERVKRIGIVALVLGVLGGLIFCPDYLEYRSAQKDGVHTEAKVVDVTVHPRKGGPVWRYELEYTTKQGRKIRGKYETRLNVADSYPAQATVAIAYEPESSNKPILMDRRIENDFYVKFGFAGIAVALGLILRGVVWLVWRNEEE